MLRGEKQQLVEQAPVGHAVAKPSLVRRQHEEHLVDEETRVIGVARAAEPEQEVDLVDAREVAGVGTAIDLTADVIGFVVGPHAIEEAVDVEIGEEPIVCADDVARPSFAASKRTSATGLDTPSGTIAGERVGGTLKTQNAAGVLVDEQELIRERGEALATACDGEIVGGEMRGGEARRHTDRRADVERQRRGLGEGRALVAVGIGELVAAERAHIEPDVAEHAERALEAFAGISLMPEIDDQARALRREAAP